VCVRASEGKRDFLLHVLTSSSRSYDVFLQDMISVGTPKMQCFAPLLKIVNDAFGIDQAAMTVVHQCASEALVTGERSKAFGEKPSRHFRAYVLECVRVTLSLSLLSVCVYDDSHSPTSYGNHIFPIRSSSCSLIGNVIPEMEGKLCGATLFVPTVETSATDVSSGLSNRGLARDGLSHTRVSGGVLLAQGRVA
jgi:glyceraldehyde 3-phosphate dehydrogenase